MPAPKAPASAYVFPIELDDGRQTAISWHKGGDHAKVAHDFLTKEALPLDSIASVVGVLKHVEQVTLVLSTRATDPAPASEAASGTKGEEHCEGGRAGEGGDDVPENHGGEN